MQIAGAYCENFAHLIDFRLVWMRSFFPGGKEIKVKKKWV
jgi:hypothetical protein